MKSLLKLTLLILIPSLFACNKYLDKVPTDMLTMDTVFQDRIRTEGWLAGIYSDSYSPMMSATRTWGDLQFTDDAQIAIAMGQFNKYWDWIVANQQGDVDATKKPATDIWGNTYKDVRKALLFIKNVKPLPNQNLSPEQVEQMKLEARFLIAYYYQKMLERYGPFPLITTLQDVGETNEELSKPRTPLDSIVNWLDNEYLYLANHFPVEYDNPDKMFGRPDKGTCLALRSRLWMFAASPLFNGNPDYSDITNPDGTHIFPQSYEENKWQKAVDATRDFLDVAESGRYKLYKEYYDNGEIDPFLSFQNLFLKTGDINKEIVFGRASNSRKYHTEIGYPRGYVGKSGYYGSTQNLVDAFFMKNGFSPIKGYNADGSPIINNESGYTETGFSTSNELYPNTAYDLNSSRTEGLITEKGTYNMYVDREPRFYITLWYDNEWIPGADRYTEFKDGGKDGGPTHDSPQSGYLLRKKVNPAANPRDGKIPYQPDIVLRLAEFYLNYAEALNEIDPGNSDILKYINKIRERAGIPTYGNGMNEIPVSLDQKDMRQTIRKEWRSEFALEADIRYNNIRRWKTGVDIFKTPIYGMKRSKSGNNFYQRSAYMTRSYSVKNYLMPIYQGYLDNNLKLVQNKGW